MTGLRLTNYFPLTTISISSAEIKKKNTHTFISATDKQDNQ